MIELSKTLKSITALEPDVMAQSLAEAPGAAKYAQDAYELFANCVVEVAENQMVFELLYIHVRKMAGLGLLSALRQHRIESAQNLRHAIESISLMGYYGMHPGIAESWADDRVTPADIGIESETGSKRAYAWVASTYPGLSKDLLNVKGVINKYLAHASIMTGGLAFDFENRGKPSEHFFDLPKLRQTTPSLLKAGQVSMLAGFMLRRVVTEGKGVKLIDGFDEMIDQIYRDGHREFTEWKRQKDIAE